MAKMRISVSTEKKGNDGSSPVLAILKRREEGTLTREVFLPLHGNEF